MCLLVLKVVWMIDKVGVKVVCKEILMIKVFVLIVYMDVCDCVM